MKKKITLLLLALVCAITCAFGLAACGGSGKRNEDENTVAIESISLNKTTLALYIDEYETLTVTYTPATATTKSVTWSSSAPAIASVDNTGKVTAKAEGSATITAKTTNNKTATCAVTVNAPIPTDRVNASQWAQILESADNYTFAISGAGFDYLYDDNKIEFDAIEHQILVKDGDKYYVYTEMDDPKGWERITTDDDKGTPFVKNYIEEFSNLCKIFKESYSAFTYTDGKYTADDLNINFFIGGTIKTAEVTFENSNLIGIKFSTEADGGVTAQYEIKNVGTTTVTLPTKYTEATTV